MHYNYYEKTGTVVQDAINDWARVYEVRHAEYSFYFCYHYAIDSYAGNAVLSFDVLNCSEYHFLQSYMGTKPLQTVKIDGMVLSVKKKKSIEVSDAVSAITLIKTDIQQHLRDDLALMKGRVEYEDDLLDFQGEVGRFDILAQMQLMQGFEVMCIAAEKDSIDYATPPSESKSRFKV